MKPLRISSHVGRFRRTPMRGPESQGNISHEMQSLLHSPNLGRLGSGAGVSEPASPIDSSLPSPRISTTSHSTLRVPSAESCPPFCRRIRPRRLCSTISSKNGKPRPCRLCKLCGERSCWLTSADVAGVDAAASPTFDAASARSWSYTPMLSSTCRLALSRLPNVTLTLAPAFPLSLQAVKCVPQNPQNCRRVGPETAGSSKARLMFLCVSSGKCANVLLWYQSSGTRNQAERGVACERPDGALVAVV